MPDKGALCGCCSTAVQARTRRPPMKLITAVLKPLKLDDVRDALGEIAVQGMHVTEVRGVGRQRGHTEVYRGGEDVVDCLPRIRLERAVSDDQLETVIDAI